MTRVAIVVMIAALSIGPVFAAPWGTDYNMGTFAAGGGGAGQGQLNLQCGDPDAGIADYGVLNMQLTVASASRFAGESPADYVQFVVGDTSVDIPMELEQGSSTVLDYVDEAEGSVRTQALVTALRGGKSVRVEYQGVELATIALGGAKDALEAIDACIRFRS